MHGRDVVGPGRWSRRARIGAVLLVLVGVLAAGCGGQDPGTSSAGEEENQPATAVTVAEAVRGQLEQAVELNGRLRAQAEVSLRPQVAGTVQRVAVKVGQRVKAGQLLVELDAPGAEAQVRQAEAALAAAQAGLEQAQRGARVQRLQADAEAEQARLAAEAARAQRDGAQQALKDLENQWKVLGCEAGGGSAGPAGGPGASGATGAVGAATGGAPAPPAGNACGSLAASREQARATLQQAEWNLKAAQVRLKAAQDARQLLAEGDPAAAARAQVEQAEAALAAARRQLDLARITAPMDGVVAAVNVREGELTSPQAPDPLVVLVTPGSVRVELDVPEGLYRALEPRAAVQVVVDGETYRGRVAEKTMVPDARTGTYKAWVDVADADDRLVPGLSARVRVEPPDTAQAVLIPVEAIQEGERPGEGTVMVVQDGRAVRRSVRYGSMTTHRAAILEGLQPGEQVIVRGQEGLADGAPVRVVSTDGAR